MDPISVGLFVVESIAIVFLVVEARDRKRDVSTINAFLAEVAAKANAPDARVTALELENRTIKADIAEIKASRRAEVERTRQSRPGSFRAFRNQIKGAEIEQ